MFMKNVGVLSRLAYMTWGRARNHFYFIFSCGNVIFGCAFCRLMQSP